MRRWSGVALGLCALVAASCDGSSGASERPRDDADAPVVISARVVCRLIGDNEQARSVQATGSDGTQSAVAADGTQYWFFGDTVRTTSNGRQDVVPAAVATTDDLDGSDCVDLAFKSDNGTVAPMFPRLDETTAWPDGVLALENGAILFYMVKAYRTSPFHWYVGSVGLGRITPGSTTGTRITEKIWDENSGFASRVVGVRSPILQGDDVIAYIKTEDGANYVTKAPLASIELLSAYAYWDGEGWTDDPANAQVMWESPDTGFPADNGVQVTFDEGIGKWLALSNAEMARVEVRTADEPWGPWSEPTHWLDCQPLVGDRYPYCYTGELHRQLTTNNGDTLYMTFSSQEPYDVSLVELTMGESFHEWRSGDDYFYSPGQQVGWEDLGPAFTASETPNAGLVEVANAAVDGVEPEIEVLFYAAGEQQPGIPSVAVHRWTRDGAQRLSARDLDGWERGEIVFYTPCAAFDEKISGCA